ncbi:helix-turn-helix transcriptional regulator [Nocardia farcinica]|nr:helix-turn-helix transcriptional regulator [Nocardia farcinica]MBF6422517.1 helix-turn-helix transcriptional regulator [Nocardia farcinica]MBF6434597.1 helix-turn-helix transcriptional regulator [Nocardia farcinica]MBF6505696.1 helix-turn-helix transcriptional regulator [Nocardia farcinica]
MPSERIVRALGEELGADSEATLRLWRAGVAEQRAATTTPAADAPPVAASEDSRSRMSGERPIPTARGKSAPFGRGASASTVPPPEDGGSGASSKPDLSPREVEVLRHWAASESKALTAKRLDIAIGTVNTHLARIRDKYGSKGRPASTKAALVARAIQDGLLDPGEL